MGLARDARLGPYTIRALIGSGGMGEVYRAHDPRLGRDVALKVVGATLGRDPDMRRRFDEEARLAARLDHPRICAVYDVGHSAGVDYLVMELLEGETLATRLTRGPLTLAELVGYAIEIASALTYAHARDVVHRDIKPGNIFLTPAGVKIVDFGLARLRQLEQVPSRDIASLNTQKVRPMARNVVHGTPGYLSPERLEGEEGDPRSDIFAFGLVLYEMATGRRAFEAPTTAALIGAILSADPPPMVGHGTATPEIEWIVRRCMKKDPAARWQSMSDVEAVLKWIATSLQSPAPRRTSRWPVAARYLAMAAGILLVAALWLLSRPQEVGRTPAPPVAVSVAPPDEGRFTLTEASSQCAELAISPDGRLLAFVATGADGVSQMWVRSMDSIVARPVNGTANATYPFWSPNSRSLGFFANRQLRRIDLDGGPARVLADAPNGRGGTWSANDAILFAPIASGTIFRVNADGSGLAEQTSFVPGDTSHRWPQFLPDGRYFIFFARNSQAGTEGVYLASLDTRGRTMLVPSSVAGSYAPPHHLLYVADGTLIARTLDVAHAKLTGEPVPVVANVGSSSNYYGAFSASSTGVLAYAPSGSAAELRWIGRDGRTLSVAAERASYLDFDISRERHYVAVAQAEPHAEHPDIHVLDLQRGGNTRITTARETDASPVWSPDGTRLVFRSNRERVHDLFLIAPNSPASDELLLRTNAAKYPTDWTDEGRVIYHSDMRQMGWDIWAVPVEPRGEPIPLVQTSEDEVQGRLSRSGRWLAYTQFTSRDKPEVYAQALRDGESRVPISVNGGSDPHWSADDRELFYIAPDGTLMSVAVHGESALNPGNPKPLFRIPGVRVAPPFPSRYDVDPSGQRFLVFVPLDDAQTLPLNVLVNWSPESTSR